MADRTTGRVNKANTSTSAKTTYLQEHHHLYRYYSFKIQKTYLQPIITQYFIDNKSEIWLLFLIAHSKR